NVEPVALVLSIDRETSHTITVSDHRAKPLTVTSARCESNHVKMQVSAAGPNSQGQRIQQVRVTVLESCPPGHFMEPIILLTDDPEYRELRVPLVVTRKVPGQAVAVPEQLDLRLARGQSAASGLIRLRAPDEKAVVVARIETDHPALRCKW